METCKVGKRDLISSAAVRAASRVLNERFGLPVYPQQVTFVLWLVLLGLFVLCEPLIKCRSAIMPRRLSSNHLISVCITATLVLADVPTSASTVSSIKDVRDAGTEFDIAAVLPPGGPGRIDDIVLYAGHAAILNSDSLLPETVETPSIETSTPFENPIVISLNLAFDSAATTLVVALGTMVVANSKETTSSTPLPLFAASPMSVE